jgi:hypothetical protein
LIVEWFGIEVACVIGIVAIRFIAARIAGSFRAGNVLEIQIATAEEAAKPE